MASRAASKIVRRLCELNRLLSASEPQVSIEPTDDPRFDLMTVRKADGGVMRQMKLQRKDVNVPVKIVQSVRKGTFYAGNLPPGANPMGDAKRLTSELEVLIEQYYTDAFRVLKLVQQLPRQRKFAFIAVVWVRNDLIEHPKDEGQRQNFGFGDGGPFVRPLRSSTMVRDDAGLLANTAEFLSELERRFPVEQVPPTP